MESIHYSIFPLDPGAHLFEVALWIEQPDPSGQCVALPTWIPGSYLIREFARHIDRVAAFSLPEPPPLMTPGLMLEALQAGTASVAIQKQDKNHWRCEPVQTAGHGLLLRYRVYAWDLSVRAAHLDESHGFFNGSSVFLRVCGQESLPCSVDILPPAGERFADWRVATTLPRAETPVPAKSRKTSTGRRAGKSALRALDAPTSFALLNDGDSGFGRYRAIDYDELIDHPVEMGRFQWASFEAGGCRHEIAITGKAEVDFERLIRDLQPICRTQIELFEPKGKQAPVKRYLFMTMAVGDGYGGLEHRASTALICSRNDLPWPGMDGMPDGYRTFLGLASHEYFHTWNVKRIKPARFAPYDLDRESYTQLLWVFEGFTSYYDDLMLVRAGVIDEAGYLQLLEQNIRRVAGNPGRLLQSVAESSHDAWIKYYRPDENTNNAVSSYYVKGSLVALCLDLTIRARTGSKHSLDDVMRLMWQRYGRDFYTAEGGGRGMAEDEMPALIKEATGLDLSRQIKAWAYGTAELPLAQCLKSFGLNLFADKSNGKDRKHPAAALGAKTALRNGELTITSAERGGPASNAGLSAGDALVAIDGLRATEAGLKTLLARRQPGDTVSVLAFRRDELISATVRLAQAPTELKLKVTDEENEARARWLGRVLKRSIQRKTGSGRRAKV